MPTPIDDTYKNMIGKKLTNQLGLALHVDQITLTELESFILTFAPFLQSLHSKEEVNHIFEKLSQGWPFLKEVLAPELQSQTDSASTVALA